MANERRGDRRPPSRPGGGGYGGGDHRPYRGRPPRGGGEEAPREFTPRPSRGGYGRPPAREGYGRPPERESYGRRPAGDEGGMSIRVDPRRLSLLKELAGAEGLRPGQLVQRWVEERLDAERSGEPVAAGRPEAAAGMAGQRMALLETRLTALTTRVDEMVERLRSVEGMAFVDRSTQRVEATTGEATAAPRRRGRPPKVRPEAGEPGVAAEPVARRTGRRRAATARGGRVALHDEIIAVIRDEGPMTAAQLAETIKERGRYQAPRSARPLDAATVNSRVSNPVYRSRFRREGGRIGLAE